MNISIIVTHHLSANNQYLQACLESIMDQKINGEIETILISDADTLPELPPLPNLTVVHDEKLNNIIPKIKHGVSIAKHDYVLLLSDDVILMTRCLEAMIVAQEGLQIPIIQNPLCNGDTPSKYIAPIIISDENNAPVAVPQTLDLPWLSGKRDVNGYREIMLFPFDWVATYCTMMPKQLLIDIPPDESLDCKNWDVDFCWRAGRKGIPSMVNTAARAIHFGSKTLSVTKTPEMEAQADKVFSEKVRGGFYV